MITSTKTRVGLFKQKQKNRKDNHTRNTKFYIISLTLKSMSGMEEKVTLNK